MLKIGKILKLLGCQIIRTLWSWLLLCQSTARDIQNLKMKMINKSQWDWYCVIKGGDAVRV